MPSRTIHADELIIGDRRVRRIEIRRAERANSLTIDLMNRLADAILESGERPIVLTARGAHFCAGLDLYALAAVIKRDQSPRRMLDPLRVLYTAMLEHCSPTMCLVNGAAVAGGLGLAAATDRIVATETACFTIPARIPLLAKIPAAIARARRPLIGVDDWIGWRADAVQALHVGLVSGVVSVTAAHPIEALIADQLETEPKPSLGWVARSGHRAAALTSLASECDRVTRMAESRIEELARSVDAVIHRWSYRRGESCRTDWSNRRGD